MDVNAIGHQQGGNCAVSDVANNTETIDEEVQPEEKNEAEESISSSLEERFKEEIAKAMQEAQENKDRWMRAQAEFQNYKKRTARELMESQQKGSLDALMKFLPIMDDFERAMENIPEDLQDNPWFGGISLLQGKFKKLLEEYDVEEVIPTGELFDPNLHQAIGMDESDEVESGHVTATLQKGYINGERILRPALVRVAN